MEKVVTQGSWGRYISTPLVSLWQECQGKVQSTAGSGAHAFIRVCQTECFGFPRLRLDWSIQNRKSSILVSFNRILSKGSTRVRPWEVCYSANHKGGQKSLLRNLLYIYLGHWGLQSRACTPGKGYCQFKGSAGHLATNMDTEVAI